MRSRQQQPVQRRHHLPRRRHRHGHSGDARRGDGGSAHGGGAAHTAADAAVKLLLKVTPKRRDMKELWLAAATFGSLAPLPLLSESEFCVSSTNCPQFSRWQKFCQIV